MDQHNISQSCCIHLSEEASINFGKSHNPVTHQDKETLERYFPYGRIITGPDDGAPDQKSSCWYSIEFEMYSSQGSQEILLVEPLLGHNLVDFAKVIHDRTGILVVKWKGIRICQDYVTTLFGG